MKDKWHQKRWDKITERKKKLKEGEGWKFAAMICKVVGHEWEKWPPYLADKCKRCGNLEPWF
jgi:hypothetical protein